MNHKSGTILAGSGLAILALLLASCSQAPPAPAAAVSPSVSSYFDNSGRDDVLSGGVKMLDITTPDGPHKVWTNASATIRR